MVITIKKIQIFSNQAYFSFNPIQPYCFLGKVKAETRHKATMKFARLHGMFVCDVKAVLKTFFYVIQAKLQ